MAQRFSWHRSLLIIVVGLLLAGIIVLQAAQPLRQDLAQRYLARGDAFFAAQNYDQAENEYQRALRYNSQLSLAQDNLDLVQKATTDIVLSRQFFADHNRSDIVQKIDEATQTFGQPKDAVKQGVHYITQGDFVYARYPLEQAIKLDPNYPEAWHYLAQTYQELAKYDPSFQTMANAAIKRQNILTPQYLKL